MWKETPTKLRDVDKNAFGVLRRERVATVIRNLERREAKTVVAQTPASKRKPEIFSLNVLLMWYFILFF